MRELLNVPGQVALTPLAEVALVVGYGLGALAALAIMLAPVGHMVYTEYRHHTD